MPGSVGKNAVCYLLFCYQSVEYVSFLLASIYREEDAIIIHCDPKAPARLKSYLAEIIKIYPNIKLIQPQYYSWAGYSHVEVTLKAVAFGLTTDSRWSHIVFLSEQHLPLKSPGLIASGLSGKGSVVALTNANRLDAGSRADIENRFGAVYQELPGVGSFAIGEPEWQPNFLDSVWHGSNWFAMSREHSQLVLDFNRAGRFDIFSKVIHAEETAIQSLIAPFSREEDLFDTTIVAWPHLTNNGDLVITESLFRSHLDSPHFFIRKRPGVLSDFMYSTILANHFVPEIYNLRQEVSDGAENIESELSRYICEALIDAIKTSLLHLNIRRVGDGAQGAGPRIHLVITSSDFAEGVSIRVISENMKDYKVCLLEKYKDSNWMILPLIKNNTLISNARVKVYDVFGYKDILPLDLPNNGFVTIAGNLDLSEIVGLIKQLSMHAN